MADKKLNQLTQTYSLDDDDLFIVHNTSSLSIAANDLRSQIRDRVINSTVSSLSIQPNILYIWSNPSSLTITLATPSNTNIVNEYMIQFSCTSTMTSLTLPSSIIWFNGESPIIELGKTYQISIINNLGVWGAFE